MNKSSFTFSLFVLGVFTLIGCNPSSASSDFDFDQNRITTDYYLDYQGDNRTSYAGAFFYLEGELYALKSEAKLFFSDRRILPSGNSMYTSLGGVVESGTFIYTDLNENTYTNEVAIADPIEVPEQISLQKSGGTVSWEGAPHSTGISTQLLISVPEMQIYLNFQADQNGQTSFSLTENDLASIPSGTEVQIQFARYKEVPVQHSPVSATGKFMSNYSSSITALVLQ